MISGISFHILSEEQKNEIPNYSKFFESDNITKIGTTIVLPNKCIPDNSNFDGVFKDNLKILYEQLNDAFLKEDDEKVEQIRIKIQAELKIRIGTGKNGRFRRDLAGKRTNYCARAVMTGNTFLRLNEVSLPIKFKSILTLTEIYENQTDDILYVIENKKKFDIRFKKPIKGQLIVRSLKEGELVIVNRQPTLRTSNFISMNVVWNHTNTIQLHPGVLSLFDGDFDGDELNIHLPQMNNKLLEDLHIKNELFDMANNSLNPSIIQDAVIGNCLYDYKDKYEIQNEIIQSRDILDKIKNMYDIGLQDCYFNGFSVGFDLKEIDFMIDTKAKGNKNHKIKIREYLNGLADEKYFDEIKKCRISQISTSLKTSKAGYISRRLSYHLDDLIYDKENDEVREGSFILDIKVPEKFKHITNIGLYAVSCITPPITQSILDSFHYASSGEDFTDATDQLEKVLNCSDEKVSIIYKDSGIDKVNEYLMKQLKCFFGSKVDDFWLKLLSNFICITGKPIGFSSSSLIVRHREYLKLDENHQIPILKIAKFSSPMKIINESIKNEYFDDLETNHSREIFINNSIV